MVLCEHDGIDRPKVIENISVDFIFNDRVDSLSLSLPLSLPMEFFLHFIGLLTMCVSQSVYLAV